MMGDPIFWLIWYCCGGLYTVALTATWESKVNHANAAVMWPLFWIVVAVAYWRRR